MGYCIDMELRDVKFNKQHVDVITSILKELNVEWLKSNDWCRFTTYNENLLDIIEEIGFETRSTDNYIYLTDFCREKLGDHENMFNNLAPYLEDCQIVIEGEDGEDWRLDIKDGSMSKYYREDL